MMFDIERETQAAVEKQVKHVFEKAALYDVMFIFLREYFHDKGLYIWHDKDSRMINLQQRDGINIGQYHYLNDALKTAFEWIEKNS